MKDSTSPRSGLLEATASFVAALRWEGLPPAVRARLPLLVLDVAGCAVAGRRLGAHGGFRDVLVRLGGCAESTIWLDGRRVPAPHAALANGTLAHHVEMDDGNPRASLHGGVTIVPAALALAEAAGATGRELLTAISAGYSAAVACARPLVAGMSLHRLHPPSQAGAFGAAAAAARVLRLDGERTAQALALAGTSLPFGPFEPFTRGATVKDLYGGWPAMAGVTAALLAAEGLEGPADLFGAQADGLGTFLLHHPALDASLPDVEEPLHVQFKPFATCRSVQPALTALEALLPVDVSAVDRIVVETYPFAVGLSRDSDDATPIGAKTSIPYGVATLLAEGGVMPDAFTPQALAAPDRRNLAARVEVRTAEEMADPVVRGARVTLLMRDGTARTSEVGATRWSAGSEASGHEVREKFRVLAGDRAAALEAAVDRLETAPDVGGLVAALGPAGAA